MSLWTPDRKISCVKSRDIRLKFWIKPLKETDLGVDQAFFSHKGNHNFFR